ncbi:MAG: hypothetical protein WCJ35_07510 [Planctomycetota bacterium]
MSETLLETIETLKEEINKSSARIADAISKQRECMEQLRTKSQKELDDAKRHLSSVFIEGKRLHPIEHIDYRTRCLEVANTLTACFGDFFNRLSPLASGEFNDMLYHVESLKKDIQSQLKKLEGKIDASMEDARKSAKASIQDMAAQVAGVIESAMPEK